MKKYINILIVVIIMILPINIKGSTYNVEKGNAQDYLNRSNYVHTYSRYLINVNDEPYNVKKIPFGFSNGRPVANNSFRKAGFISREEYKLTIDSKLYGTGKEISYLNEGMAFWTQDEEGTKAYIINKKGKEELIEQELTGVTTPVYGRATVFVKSETKISGVGTISQPWTFDPIYKVTLKTDAKKVNAEIDETTNGVYVRGNCREADCTAEIKYTTKDGYVYMTDDCGGVNNSYRNTISVSNIDRDTVCNVKFGIGRYKITLKDRDTTGDIAEQTAEPDEIYLKYGTGFYTDYEFLSQIRKLTVLPEKSGRRFDGYVNEEKTIWLTDKEGVINQEAKNQITSDSVFYIEWYHNKYTIRYVLGHESAMLGASSPSQGIYDDTGALKIDKPTRQGYNFAGWKVQGIDISTAKYGTSANNVNTAFTSYGQTINANAIYFYNLNGVDGATVTFTATWTPRTDTIYTVNRWKQRVDTLSETKVASNYDLDVRTYTGTSDQSVQAPQEQFTGFTPITSVGEVFVKYDGSGSIDYYYRRNKVKISFYMAGGQMRSQKGSEITTSGDLIKISGQNYRPYNYGQTIKLPEWNDEGYINLVKVGYTPVEGKEWCTGQNGSGTCYNMMTNYPSSQFCNAGSGDCTVNLYVNWKATEYDISYVLNEGSHTKTPKKGTYDVAFKIENPTKTITLTGNANGITNLSIGDPTRQAQTFAGWTATGLDTTTAKHGTTATPSTAWNGNTKVTSKYFKNLRSIPGTVELTANWTPVKFKTPTVEKKGYTCVWCLDEACTGATRIESGGYYEPTANNVTSVTIYAECTPNTYNISLKPNGGTLGTSKPTSGTYDQAVTISYPTRGGYNFTGWLGNTVVDSTTAKYGNSSTVSEINTSWSTPTTTKVKKNYFKNLTPVKNATVELTAQWGAIEYNIDYNLKYGTNDSSAPTKMKYDEPKQIKNPTKKITINVSKGNGTYGTNAGSGVTLNPTTASAAQTFAGWTADDGLNTSTAYTGSASNSVNTKWSNKDTKVKTEWFKNLRNTSDGKVTLIANWTKVDVTMPEITKKGYECWYNTANDQSGTKIVSGGKYVTSENTKASVPIYSFCKAKQYNVTLNNQGASTAGSTSITPTFDAAMPSITKPAKTFKVTYNYNGNGTSNTEATSTYTFGGYYDKTGGEGKQYINSSGTSANVWDKDSDTTLYAKWTGGSVTLPSPKRSGYAFDGWYSGNTKVGVGGATYYPTATITLTAHWTACGPGYYLNGNTCAKCGKNKYSTGTANASCTSCKDGYTTTGETSTSKTDCKITCTENQTVKTANSKCEACSKGYGRAGNETVSEGNVGTACRLIKYSI